jgi:hypothetical protein
VKLYWNGIEVSSADDSSNYVNSIPSGGRFVVGQELTSAYADPSVDGNM